MMLTRTFKDQNDFTLFVSFEFSHFYHDFFQMHTTVVVLYCIVYSSKIVLLLD